MKQITVFLLLLNAFGIHSQEKSNLVQKPTAAQISLSITLFEAYGELNFPNIFEDKNCYFITNAQLLDSLAIPKYTSHINKMLNLFDSKELNIKKEYKIANKLFKEYVSVFENRQITIHQNSRDEDSCINLKFSPVYKKRIFTAVLRKKIDDVFNTYFVVFYLDDFGDIYIFDLFEESGERVKPYYSKK